MKSNKFEPGDLLVQRYNPNVLAKVKKVLEIGYEYEYLNHNNEDLKNIKFFMDKDLFEDIFIEKNSNMVYDNDDKYFWD